MVKKKISLLWLFVFVFVFPLLGWPLVALASYEKYMPQQKTLPGGFQLMEMQESEHAVYGTSALSGIWQLKGIGYHYSPQNEPQGKNDREWMGYINQQDMEAAVYIHVVIGEKTDTFNAYLNRFSSQDGFMEIPWATAFQGGQPISLDVDEEEAVHLSSPPGYIFSKGDIGVLVLSSPDDPWHWEKLGLSRADMDKVLLTIAQSIGKSIPGSDQGIGGLTGKGASPGEKTNQQLPSATILLATALSGLVLTSGALVNVAINRPAVAPANAQTPAGTPHIGEERNGQVWCKPPWDQGGPGWISKAEYNQIQNMTAQGKVWSDRWGWVDPDTLQQNEASRARNWANFTRQDQSALKINEAINKARQGYNQSLHNILNNQRRYELEINQIRNLRQAGIEAKNVARWEMICKNTEAVSWTADQTINVMGKVVPGGGYISDGYTVLKGTAEGLGNAIAEGGNYTRHLAKDKAQEGAFNALKRSGRQ